MRAREDAHAQTEAARREKLAALRALEAEQKERLRAARNAVAEKVKR